MNNRGLLVVIAIILAGILGVLVMQYQHKQETPMEKIGQGVGDALENAGDSIKDSTN